LFVRQRHLMYHLSEWTQPPAETLIPSAELRRVESEPGLEITSWYLPPADGKPVILYFHGNAGTLAERDFKVAPWAEAGYGIWLAGYRGFSGNPGMPSEQGLYADAHAALAGLRAEGIGPERIVLYGESLGSGIATHMAAEMAASGTPARALVLEAPFTSMGAAAQDRYWYVPANWLVRDRYDSLSKIARIEAPLLIVHGDKDKVVRQKHGRRLFEAAAEPKQAHWVDGGGHTDLFDFGVGDQVQAFFDSLDD